MSAAAVVVQATGKSTPAIVEVARYKAPPETRRILMLAQIIGSDGFLPPGIESVEITVDRIVLHKRKDPYVR